MAINKYGRKPPNPDPGNYIWVVTKEGGFWRKKRGSVTKAKLNTAYKQGAEDMKVSAPAASRIVKKLRPFMKGLRPGRINARVSAILRKGLRETGRPALCYLQDFDFQTKDAFKNLVGAVLKIEQTANEFCLKIPITKSSINNLNGCVTHYYFELVLLYGDITRENALRTESEESVIYSIEKENVDDCRLVMILPDQEWMALLKVNCIEERWPAKNQKVYGLKVIKTSINV